MTQTKSVFNQFIGKYQLSKTLRFELKPVGNTGKLLEGNNIFSQDKRLAEQYEKAKPYFDELHRMFVKESFSKEKLKSLRTNSFADAYETILATAKKALTNEQKKQYADERKILLKEICRLLEETGNDWKNQYSDRETIGKNGKKKKIKFSSTGYKILTDEAVLHILMDNFPGESEIFSPFLGFFTYFYKFNETRENFYKDDGAGTAVATRAVENLERFLRNKHIVENEYGHRKKEIGLTDDEISVLTDIERYKNRFLQASIDEYNAIIGGRSETEKSVNKKVNEYRQKTGNKIPFLAKLHKQILGEKDKKEIVSIEDEKSLLEQLQSFSLESEKYNRVARELLMGVFKRRTKEFDLSKIFVSHSAVNTLSSKYFTDWTILKGALADTDFTSLAQIQNALNQSGETPATDLFKVEIQEKATFDKTRNHFNNFLAVFINEASDRINDCTATLNELKKDDFWKTGKIDPRKEKQTDRGTQQIGLITAYLNACRDAHRMVKYFALEKNKQWVEPEDGKDERFYGSYQEYYENYHFFPFYDACRNFLTKKPSDEGKIKLNFNNSQLLSGWDKNKEKEKLGVILRKDGTYYLGIINKDRNDIFDEKKHPEAYKVVDDSYEKMEYKLFPDPKRMIPKIAFAEGNKEAFCWTREIQDIKDEYARFQEEKMNDRNSWKKKFDQKKLSALIAYYQYCLIKGGYQKTFDFKWRKPEEYTGIGEFNDEIAHQNYRLRFVPVDSKYVDEKVERGELFFFKIYGKDFADGAKGIKNIHSLYFLQLFSSENLNLNPPALQMSGNAEIFYREPSVKDKDTIVTKKGTKIEKKDTEVYHYKRYTEPKVFFHVPISINAGAGKTPNPKQFNHGLNVKLLVKQAEDIKIIGIDRGEKHLAYYSVINQRGEILEQESLNKIEVKTKDGIKWIDYHKLLDDKEKERLANRQSWLPLRQIKDLKRGFVGHAVKKICDLVIQHDAIVVLEDLNMRFKQIRGGIERSVYQQFEKALIDKLGYLVFKDKTNIHTPGGILNGYQLSAPFVSFKKIGKQTGIIFYVQAAYTSVTDPVTGFRKNVYIGNSDSQDKIKRAVETFDAIGWDGKKQSYFFIYNPINFVSDKDKGNTYSKDWTIYANVPRILRQQNKLGRWTSKPENPNDMLVKLFETWKFENHKSTDMKAEILLKQKRRELTGKKEFDGKERDFWHSFIYIFNIILSIRNSFSKRPTVDDAGNVTAEGENIDFIASPVRPFFTTPSKYSKPNFANFENRFIGPTEAKKDFLADFNGDANGAYNIARKGIMILKRIQKNPEKPELYLNKKDWDEYVSG